MTAVRTDTNRSAGTATIQSSGRRFKNISTQLFLTILATCLLAVVAIFVQATYAAEAKSDQKVPFGGLDKIDVSTTLAVLRAAQGVLSALTAIILKDCFVFLQWGMMDASSGLSYLTYLALSPTTQHLGTLGLIRSSASRLVSKVWALSRLEVSFLMLIALC